MKIISYYPKYSKWIFILLLIGVSFIYDYHQIMFLRPQSIHQWRQTDCLSLTLNYYQEGMDFFSPSIHNHISNEGNSGNTAGEFPALYYFVALLWKIFGQHEFIYRIVGVLITFLGLFALFKVLEDTLKDSVWAIGSALLVFTSPLIIFYSIGFLTDVPAFSFALMGWYFFYRFYKSGKIKLLYFSMALLLLGGLLKITAAMSFIVIASIFFIELLNIYKFKGREKIFKHPFKELFPFLMVATGILSWYIFAHYYNLKHGGKYTFNSVWPLWEMDNDAVQRAVSFFNEILVHQIFSSITIAVIILLFFALLFFKARKINALLLVSTLLLFVGSIIYVILWFNALDGHDYYFINLLILPVFMVAAFLYFLKINHFKIFDSLFLKIPFLLFLTFNVLYGANNIQMRYWNYTGMHMGQGKSYTSELEAGFWAYTAANYPLFGFETITDYNRSLGIKQEDIVISIPDPSINISLYLMNQKGWTAYSNQCQDSANVMGKIALGAKYLFISDTLLYEREYIHHFTQNKIGEYKGISIYDLQQIKN